DISGDLSFLEFGRLRLHFDVVEIPDWMAEGLLFSLRGVLPVVAHLHTPLRLIREHNGLSMTRTDRWADALERIAVGCAHVITCPSRLLVERLEKSGWLKHHRVRVIRLPVGLDQWVGLPAGEATDPVILQVGRIEPIK